MSLPKVRRGNPQVCLVPLRTCSGKSRCFDLLGSGSTRKVLRLPLSRSSFFCVTQREVPLPDSDSEKQRCRTALTCETTSNVGAAYRFKITGATKVVQCASKSPKQPHEYSKQVNGIRRNSSRIIVGGEGVHCGRHFNFAKAADRLEEYTAASARLTQLSLKGR